MAVVTAVLGSWVIGAIEASGRSAETAIGLVSDMLSTWLATRVQSESVQPSA